MESVIAIESEVFGSCVGKLDVSVGMENRVDWLCCGLIYLSLFGAGNAAQYLRWRWEMVPGIGGILRLALSMVRQ